jgi:hypothetical protein
VNEKATSSISDQMKKKSLQKAREGGDNVLAR